MQTNTRSIRSTWRSFGRTGLAISALLGLALAAGLAHAGGTDEAYWDRQRQETQQRLDSWQRENAQNYRNQEAERYRDQEASRRNQFEPPAYPAPHSYSYTPSPNAPTQLCTSSRSTVSCY